MEEFYDSATKTAYDGIRRMIFVTHELKPGQKMVESTIAKKLNISRTPVREAIHSLVQDGVVERIQNRGTYVCVPTRQQIVNNFEIAAALAAMTCYLLAERKKNGDDIDEILRNLRDAVEAMEGAEIDTRLMLDRDFHRYISSVCGNEHLCELWQHSHERCFHDIWNIPNTLFDPKVADAEHRLLLDAIENGDAVHAQRVAMAHMLRTRERILTSEQLT